MKSKFNNEDEDSEEDEYEGKNDTGRPLNTEILNGKTVVNDFFKASASHNDTSYRRSTFTYRENQSFKSQPKTKSKIRYALFYIHINSMHFL